jgi:hypothetical protein
MSLLLSKNDRKILLLKPDHFISIVTDMRPLVKKVSANTGGKISLHQKQIKQ